MRFDHALEPVFPGLFIVSAEPCIGERLDPIAPLVLCVLPIAMLLAILRPAHLYSFGCSREVWVDGHTSWLEDEIDAMTMNVPPTMTKSTTFCIELDDATAVFVFCGFVMSQLSSASVYVSLLLLLLRLSPLLMLSVFCRPA